MTSLQVTETAQEIMQRLAALHEECPSTMCQDPGTPVGVTLSGSYEVTCCLCKGSGKVPRFKTLRQVCSNSLCEKGKKVVWAGIKNDVWVKEWGDDPVCEGSAFILYPEQLWRSLIEDIALELGWAVHIYPKHRKYRVDIVTIKSLYEGREIQQCPRCQGRGSYSGFQCDECVGNKIITKMGDTTTNLLRAFIQAVEAE